MHIEVIELLDHMIGLYALSASRHAIHLVAGSCPRSLVVTADRRALEQILSNLVDNAIKYASAGANVTLSATVIVALLVCLIPTTIGGLLSAIGIAGMDRLVQHNVLAMSGRAVVDRQAFDRGVGRSCHRGELAWRRIDVHRSFPVEARRQHAGSARRSKVISRCRSHTLAATSNPSCASCAPTFWLWAPAVSAASSSR
jgi:hypothetical protein